MGGCDDAFYELLLRMYGLIHPPEIDNSQLRYGFITRNEDDLRVYNGVE